MEQNFNIGEKVNTGASLTIFETVYFVFDGNFNIRIALRYLQMGRILSVEFLYFGDCTKIVK